MAGIPQFLVLFVELSKHLFQQFLLIEAAALGLAVLGLAPTEVLLFPALFLLFPGRCPPVVVPPDGGIHP